MFYYNYSDSAPRLTNFCSILDITDENSVTKAKKTTDDILTTDGLNVLINNAAIYLTCSSIRDINLEEMIQSYRSNVVGPALMCRVSFYFYFSEQNTIELPIYRP